MTGHITISQKLTFQIFPDKKLFLKQSVRYIYMFLTSKLSSSLELLNLIFLLFRGDTNLMLCHFVLYSLQCSSSCLFSFSLLSDFPLINSNINLCYAKERKKERKKKITEKENPSFETILSTMSCPISFLSG